MKKHVSLFIVFISLLSILLIPVSAANTITVSPKSIIIAVNETVSLKATTSPKSQKVSYKSSNSSIVKVTSKGKITGVKAGKATVTASFKYKNKNYKSNCSVVVKKPYIKLNYDKITLYKGDTKTLKASSFPEKTTYSWKSNNTSIAKVSSSGKITALKAGTAKITASFKYNNITYTKSVSLTIKTPSLKLNTTEETLFLGDTLSLKATSTPGNQTIKWKTSNSEIATVSSKGVVKAIGEGSATITAYFTYKSITYRKTCRVTVDRANNSASFEYLYDFLIENGDYDGTEYTHGIVLYDGNGENTAVSLNYDEEDEVLYFWMGEENADCILGFYYNPGDTLNICDIYCRVTWDDGTRLTGTAYNVEISEFNPDNRSLRFKNIPDGNYTDLLNLLANYGLSCFEDYLNQVHGMSLYDLGFEYY